MWKYGDGEVLKNVWTGVAKLQIYGCCIWKWRYVLRRNKFKKSNRHQIQGISKSINGIFCPVFSHSQSVRSKLPTMCESQWWLWNMRCMVMSAHMSHLMNKPQNSSLVNSGLSMQSNLTNFRQSVRQLKSIPLNLGAAEGGSIKSALMHHDQAWILRKASLTCNGVHPFQWPSGQEHYIMFIMVVNGGRAGHADVLTPCS